MLVPHPHANHVTSVNSLQSFIAVTPNWSAGVSVRGAKWTELATSTVTFVRPLHRFHLLLKLLAATSN